MRKHTWLPGGPQDGPHITLRSASLLRVECVVWWCPRAVLCDAGKTADLSDPTWGVGSLLSVCRGCTCSLSWATLLPYQLHVQPGAVGVHVSLSCRSWGLRDSLPRGAGSGCFHETLAQCRWSTQSSEPSSTGGDISPICCSPVPTPLLRGGPEAQGCEGHGHLPSALLRKWGLRI